MTFWCFRASRARFCSWYWYFPKSMMRQTGGCAVAAIFHQVEPLLPGDGQRLLRRHDAELLAGVIDDTDLAHADAFVDPRAVVTSRAGAIESDMDLL